MIESELDQDKAANLELLADALESIESSLRQLLEVQGHDEHPDDNIEGSDAGAAD